MINKLTLVSRLFLALLLTGTFFTGSAFLSSDVVIPLLLCPQTETYTRHIQQYTQAASQGLRILCYQKKHRPLYLTICDDALKNDVPFRFYTAVTACGKPLDSYG